MTGVSTATEMTVIDRWYSVFDMISYEQPRLFYKPICNDQKSIINSNQEFVSATTDIKMKMIRVHNTAFFSSNNWVYDSKEALKFGRTLNVNIRIGYNIPRDTQCCIVEDLMDGRHFW